MRSTTTDPDVQHAWAELALAIKYADKARVLCRPTTLHPAEYAQAEERMRDAIVDIGVAATVLSDAIWACMLDEPIETCDP